MNAQPSLRDVGPDALVRTGELSARHTAEIEKTSAGPCSAGRTRASGPTLGVTAGCDKHDNAFPRRGRGAYAPGPGFSASIKVAFDIRRSLSVLRPCRRPSSLSRWFHGYANRHVESRQFLPGHT